ncbi:MAG TPA: Fic family protein [Solirubrobacteraceae bacterium]|jgi:death-on-curing protein|nr:Fic family protein [Solirubrobacteraceae bacterium]
MARSAGVNPESVVLALIERGVEIDDPERSIEGATRKITRAIIKEICGGPPARIRARSAAEDDTEVLEPAPRSSALIGMLTVEDVAFIHERLCEDFSNTQDPIDPPGIREDSLLESAVGRQHAGYAELLKYPDPILNAATLLYGICNDHPFHNGNKRTALVSALAHLDKNNLVLRTTKQTELFNLMIAVANHGLLHSVVKMGRNTERIVRRGTPDEEVKTIAEWLRCRVNSITRGEKPITYRELRQILGNFGFSLHARSNGKMDVCRTETRRTLLLKKTRDKTLMAIRWPGEGRSVPIKEIKHIRQTLKLCEEDGVTSDSFYAKGVRVDRFINDYRTVLRRLASR